MWPAYAHPGQLCLGVVPQEGFNEHLLLNGLTGTEGTGPGSEELRSGLGSAIVGLFNSAVSRSWLPYLLEEGVKLHDAEGSTSIPKTLFSRIIGPGTLSSAPT